uniref:Cl2158_1 n=1 Tax=Arundo donax TaxID=35708 RepID=A0A0A9DSJ9_ARUDO
MTRSDPLVTAMSVSDMRRVRGRNAAACCRSSISPRSLSGSASTSAISSARSRVRMVCAIAMPTLPAPITDTLVRRRRCAVGVQPPSATGRKKPEDASPASKPSSDSDEAFFIVVVVFFFFG